MGSCLNDPPTLSKVKKLCRALGVYPGNLLEIVDDPPKAKRTAKNKRAGGTPRK